MRQFVISLVLCFSFLVPTLAIDEVVSPDDTLEVWVEAWFAGDSRTTRQNTCEQDLVDVSYSRHRTTLLQEIIEFISSNRPRQVDLSDVSIALINQTEQQAIVQIVGVVQAMNAEEDTVTVSLDATVVLIVEDDRWKVCVTEANLADIIPESRTDDGAFLLGDPDAPVTIVIFEDYLCPHCQSYHPIMEEFLETEVRAGNANVEFRHLIAIDPELSPLVFQMVECAAIMNDAPDSYRQARNSMFDLTTTTRLSNQTIRQYVAELKLSYDDFVDCVENDATQWQTDIEFAQTLDWVRGTPAIGWKTGDSTIQQTNPSRPTVEELADFVRANS